ncbi:hypothetical protein VZT92_017996 [Zoarces viviparus]|uniref:Uncharacterized protein n=1 Tax=Zoarces viviparus TaxID=48416 RepID=A0AAW1EP16_ZOAVI
MFIKNAMAKTQEHNLLSQTILDLESCVSQKDSELIRSEAEWKIKLTDLEDRMRSEHAANEESFQREQELQRQSRKMEVEWCNQKEEEIKLLTQQNADLQEHNLSLQELAQQTDKEKEQFKKEQTKLRQTILDLESCATQKDSELIRSKAEWKIKLTDLEDRMRSEHAANEESFQREQELQRQSRKMEVEWCNQKEEIKLLTQQNADLQEHNLSLQELAQQTDKEKEQFKKEQTKLRQTILDLESCATQKDSELIRSKAEWKIKLTDLEDRMRSEHAAKEESFQREQELQRQSRKMEEKWRNQKEEIKLLTQQNTDLQKHNINLQELAKQTEKEKEQFKKEQTKLRQTMESYVSQKDSELIQSEAEWKIKLTDLEDRMRSEHAANEESFQREQELQRQSRKMEVEWCNQKEEIKLLTQQNADLQEHNLSLQELAQQTDKEKEQFKKEQTKLRQTILDLESCATQKDSELIQSKAEWKIKLTDLEDRMRSEHAAKEESFQREQELQRQSRKMEEKWRNQKEEIKLLTQQNTDLQKHNINLQELAKQTEKEKEQFKKEQTKLRQTMESYVSQKDSELIQSEAEWKIKLTDLEDRMRSEHAANEESFQREQELQRQSRKMEVEWCNQKEEIKLLTQQNADLQEHNLSLQELAQQTDKEKEQFKKEQTKLRQTILDLESCATQKDSELIQSKAEWKIKLTDLEDRMRSEHAANEESFQREQSLQRQSRKMEEKWRNQKEEIKLLTQQNADLQKHNLSLQELTKQTEKEREQFKKEQTKLRQTILDLESCATQKDSELIYLYSKRREKWHRVSDDLKDEPRGATPQSVNGSIIPVAADPLPENVLDMSSDMDDRLVSELRMTGVLINTQQQRKTET